MRFDQGVFKNRNRYVNTIKILTKPLLRIKIQPESLVAALISQYKKKTSDKAVVGSGN